MLFQGESSVWHPGEGSLLGLTLLTERVTCGGSLSPPHEEMGCELRPYTPRNRSRLVFLRGHLGGECRLCGLRFEGRFLAF
jgi:hypothetical protein